MICAEEVQLGLYFSLSSRDAQAGAPMDFLSCIWAVRLQLEALSVHSFFCPTESNKPERESTMEGGCKAWGVKPEHRG